MVMCKFFLQGTCRFGNNCKFDHQYNEDHSYINTTSVLLQHPSNKPTPGAPVDTNTLLKSVAHDMACVEKGKQWIFSCYAPFKEKPAFPSFEDHSMEEMRYKYYEAVQNGTMQEYYNFYQRALENASMRIKILQSADPEVVNILKGIYNTPPSSSAGTYGQSTINSPKEASTIFGATSPENATFLRPVSNANGFTGDRIFNPPPQNVFAQQQTVSEPAKPSSIFGGAQQSVFANTAQQPQSMYGTAGPSTASGSIFAGQPAMNPSIFGAAQSQQQQQQSMFAVPSPPVFGQSPIMGASQPNIFQPSFAPQQQIPAVPDNANQATQHSAGIFGNASQVGGGNNNMGNIGGFDAQIRDDFYSKREELSNNDIKWFESDDLDIENIPEVPPTFEMCYQKR